MKTLVVTQNGAIKDHLKIINVDDELNPDENDIIVKVRAAAVNPIDWKRALHGLGIQSYPCPLGIDFSGIVTKVGSKVKEFKVNDPVYGRTLKGSFSEYTTVAALQAVPKPDKLMHAEAATLGVGLSTAALGLFHPRVGFGIDFPSKNTAYFKPEYVLIVGGSSSVGAFAVQLAANAGLSVITTCSPHNAEYARSLGAETVFNSSLPINDLISKIKNVAPDLQYALDCISPETTNNISAKAVKEGGKVVTINGPTKFSAIDPELQQWIKDFFMKEANPLLDFGNLRPNRVRLIENGLNGVPDALEMSANGKVSGEKLVVSIA